MGLHHPHINFTTVVQYSFAHVSRIVSGKLLVILIFCTLWQFISLDIFIHGWGGSQKRELSLQGVKLCCSKAGGWLGTGSVESAIGWRFFCSAGADYYLVGRGDARAPLQPPGWNVDGCGKQVGVAPIVPLATLVSGHRYVSFCAAPSLCSSSCGMWEQKCPMFAADSLCRDSTHRLVCA